MVTNEVVKEVFERFDGNAKQITKTLCQLSQKESYLYNEASVQIKARRVIEKCKKLSRCRNDVKLREFLKCEFIFPARNLKRKIQESNMSHVEELAELKTICSGQEKQILHLNSQIVLLKTRWRNLNIAHINQKLKRNNNTILRLRKELEELKAERKCAKKQELTTTNIAVQCNTIKPLISDLESQIDILKSEIDENNNCDKTEESVSSKTLNLKSNEKGRPYLEKLRKVYYMFLSRHVGLQHISSLIKGVLTLVDLEVEELPSTSTACNMSIEMGLLSRSHLNETLSSSDNITMHRDATTKKGHHIYGLNFSTKENNTYVAGLREVSDGKAETYVKCTKDVLSDISGHSQTFDTILNNTTNFMTDRSTTETKTNRILASHKDSPQLINEYKCSVHALLQFQSCCEKDIIEIEKDMKICLNNKEVTTTNLLKSVSKLFFKDGCGDPLYASAYLKDIGITDIPIMKYLGNRFNILFYNAAGTFYLHKYLVDYFVKSKCTLNFTQNLILDGLKDNNILAILRSLGIISKVITEPYLEKASDEKISAIEMGNVYNRLIIVLQSCIVQPDLLLYNKIQLFFGPSPPQKSQTACLFQPSDLDPICLDMIKKFCTSIRLKCLHLFKEYLEGGKFYNPSDELREQSKSCPQNNISVERLMAKFDAKLRSAPTANISTIENSIMYRSNDTEAWLNSKENNEQNNIISNARTDSKNAKLNDKLRRKELFETYVKNIREREINKKEKEQKQIDKKRKNNEDMQKLGIWDSETKIYDEISKFGSKKQKLDALKKQINNIKESIKLSPNDKCLGQFSSKGKQYNEEKLIQNMLKLLEIKNNQDPLIQLKLKIESNPQLIVDKLLKHTWHDTLTNEDTVWNGRVLAYSNKFFQVKYWATTETDGDDESFDLSIEEVVNDLIKGDLEFLDLSN